MLTLLTLPYNPVAGWAYGAFTRDSNGDVYIIYFGTGSVCCPNGGKVDTSYSLNLTKFSSGTTTNLTNPAAAGGILAWAGPSNGIVIDSNKNLYITSYLNCIYRLTSAGAWSTFAGSMATSGVTTASQATKGYTNATGTSALFNNPRGITVDGNGSIFVADSGNHAIRQITPSGVVTTFAGADSANNPGFVNGTGTAARFNNPTSIAYNINFYVGDYGNNCIRKITPAGVVTTFATGFNADSITVDQNENVFISDKSRGNVFKLNSSGVTISEFSGNFNGIFTPDGTSIYLTGSNNLFLTCASGIENSTTLSCGACSEPSGTQYVTATCTPPTTNTQFGTKPVCTTGSTYLTGFSSGSSSATGTAGSCTNCSQPTDPQYVTATCTQTTNTQFGTGVSCTPGSTYRTGYNAGSSSAIGSAGSCTNCSQPTGTQYVTATCTPTSNTQFGTKTTSTSCTLGSTYLSGFSSGSSSATGTAGSCTNCSQPTDPQYVTSTCTQTTNTQFGTGVSCTPGSTYRTGYNAGLSSAIGSAGSCTNCSQPTGTQYVTATCTPTSNTQFGTKTTSTSCTLGSTYLAGSVSGSSSATGSAGSCMNCSQPTGNQYVTANCTLTSNTQFATQPTCTLGSTFLYGFRSGSSISTGTLGTCTNCSQPSATQYITSPCTLTSNTQFGSTIKTCQPGTYVVETTDFTVTPNTTQASCEPCPQGMFSNVVNMTSCLATPANSTVTGTSDSWVCNTGYIRSGQSCVQGSCPTGNYQVKDTCVPLPLNSTVTSDGLYFQCNTGYVLSNGSCIQISASGGTINNIGNYIIHQFTSSGNFTPTSSGLVTDILIVGQGGSNVGSGGQVTYIPGYALQAQTYVIQVTGTQSSFGSFVATKGADRGGVGAGGPSGVWGRGPGLQYDTSGYSLLYGVAGGNSGLTGEPQTGNGGDTNLTGGSGAVYVRYLKTNCITGNVWDASTQTCVETCPATFPFTRNNFCTTCTTGYLSGGACVTNCPASTYGSKGTCVQCPGIQTSPVGSTSITQCICPANSYGDAGNGVCTSCPENTISTAGSTSSSACTFSCPANSYASGTNCVNCPSPTTSSPSGSLNLNACVCPSNGFLYQNTCLTQCPVNTYISGKTCMVCPGVQISSAGSTICACPTTSYGTAGSGNCTQCTGNKIANATNNGCVCPASSPQWDPIAQWCVSQCPLNTYALSGTCTNCPQNLQSPVGSTSASACSCPTILAPFYNQTSCVGLTNPGTISPSSGGTITYNNQTVIHTFTSSGTFMPPSNITNATVYVVGGGAGGSSTNGGGGAGGTVSTFTNASFSSGASYPVTIGQGGASDSPGTASSISTYTASGGSGSNQGGGVAYNITLNRIPLTNRTSPCVCTTGIANYVPQDNDDCTGIDSCQNNFYYTEYVPTRLNCVYNTSYVALNKKTEYSYNCTTDPYKYYIDDLYRPSQVARSVQSLNPATWTPLTSALSRGVPSPGTTTPYGTFGAWGGTINYGAITGAGTGLTVNSSNYDISSTYANAIIDIPFTDVSDATNAPANTGGGGGAGWVATYSSTSIINKPGGAGGSGIVIVTYPMNDECPTSLPFYDYLIGKCTTCLLYNYATPVFDASTGLCSSCSGSLIWNEKTKQCVASCSGELSFTNPTKRTCVRNTPQSCPVSAPYWNDFDCANSLTQISIYGGATGGDAIVNNGTYIVHTFTTNGNFIPIASGIIADILIVGGGGGGGTGSSAFSGGQRAYVYGGGGGGQVQYIPNVSLNVGTTYAVTVGKGGASGQNGGDSQFGGRAYTSIGGQAGGGGAYNGSGNGGGEMHHMSTGHQVKTGALFRLQQEVRVKITAAMEMDKSTL